MAREPEYFWTPRGDTRVVRNEGGRVTLAVVLASYGEGAPSWPVDHFNPLEFFCLQCIVGFWGDAKYTVAIKSMRATPELAEIVANHPQRAALDELDELSSPLSRAPCEPRWFAFATAAERIVTAASIAPGREWGQVLTFSVADPGWVVHLGPLPTWCIG